MTATVLQLPTARSVATIDVARLTDPRSYARGVDYLRRGLVEITGRRPDAVNATVLGTEPYQVRIEQGRRGLTYQCACPVGADGAFCKHLVATALAVSDIDVVEPVDDGPVTLSSADSRTAVQPVDLAAYRTALAGRFVAAERVESGAGWADGAHAILDEAETLLTTGRAAEVVDFCQQAVNCLEASAPEIADTVALLGLAQRLGDLHHRSCLLAHRPRPASGSAHATSGRRTC